MLNMIVNRCTTNRYRGHLSHETSTVILKQQYTRLNTRKRLRTYRELEVYVQRSEEEAEKPTPAPVELAVAHEMETPLNNEDNRAVEDSPSQHQRRQP